MSRRAPLVVLALLVVAAAAAPAAAQFDRRARLSWWDRAPVHTSRYYAIKTDLPRAEARPWAAHLDRMYEEYARRLASLPARGPEELRVYLFGDRRDYLDTLQAQFRIDAEGTGGMFFIDTAGSGLAFWTEGLPPRRVQHVIQHEGFHQFAYSRFGADLPMWANEGLAEFFGEAVVADGEVVLGQSTPRVIETVRGAIEDGRHIPFSTMLVTTNRQWNETVRGGDAALLYHQAWSMVHFLVYGDGGRYQPHFESYLRRINDGVLPEPAFVQVFGADIGAFEQRWTAYALAARPSAFATAMERIEFLAEGALELSGRGPEAVHAADSLVALKAQLQRLDFTHAVSRHGHAVELRAADDANFEIPPDELSGAAPAFVVTPPDRRRFSRRERALEDDHPLPPVIATENLRPRGIAVEWRRDRKTGELWYLLRVTRERS